MLRCFKLRNKIIYTPICKGKLFYRQKFRNSIDHRTAKKYCESLFKSHYYRYNTTKKKIDECAPYIDEVLSEAPYSAVRVKELVEKRFNTKIGYTTVQKYVKQIKKNYNHQVTVRFETMPGLQGQVDWRFFENYTVTDLYGSDKKTILFSDNSWIFQDALH